MDADMPREPGNGTYTHIIGDRGTNMGTDDDNRAVVETYFEALDEADFRRAADQFTPEVTYIHPPMYSDETHIHGRETLYEYFAEVRGDSGIDHHVKRSVANRDTCAVVGYVTDRGKTEPEEYFVAYAEFETGRIDYYIAGLLGLA